MQRRRRQREGERPVPHYWEHVRWVWGFDPDAPLDDFIEHVSTFIADWVADTLAEHPRSA